MKLVSLFSGCGGLDMGFENAGFEIIWSNEYNKTIHETYRKNFPDTHLNTNSITDVKSEDIPDCDGVIGGPPCQSWSAGGAKKGFADKRGKLFFEFIRVIKDKQPKFFVAENVKGLLSKKDALATILKLFKEAGYTVTYKLFKASKYGIAQDRERVFFVGIRDTIMHPFKFSEMGLYPDQTLRDVIFDIQDSVVESNGWESNKDAEIDSHEYLSEETCSYSSQYMSRNRVRRWDEFGYTVVSSGRHVTLHPGAPLMVKVEKDIFKFVDGHDYRRLSVRECARIQSFPDSFKLHYNKVNNGYKMIGNAVPPKLACVVAENISTFFKSIRIKRKRRQKKVLKSQK